MKHDRDEKTKEKEQVWSQPCYVVSDFHGYMIYDGIIEDLDDDSICNSISIVAHRKISCKSIQDNFQFEILQEEFSSDEDFSVTALLNGNSREMITLFEDMLWALYRDDKLSKEDIVHIILPKKTCTHQFFQEMGFRKVATCTNYHFDVEIKEEIKKGQIRMAAAVGVLLEILNDRQIPLPRPYKRHCDGFVQ